MKLREKIGRYSLKRKLKQFKREKHAFNFNTAKSAGIIFQLDGTPGQFEQISAFLDYLTKQRLSVMALCFFKKKKIPHYYLHLKNIHVIGPKDLTWYMTPKRLIAKNFITGNFDIMIDLCQEPTFPIQYITHLCNAKFKVGRFNENTTVYDFMINTGENTETEYFIEQTKHFLSTLNTQL